MPLDEFYSRLRVNKHKLKMLVILSVLGPYKVIKRGHEWPTSCGKP